MIPGPAALAVDSTSLEPATITIGTSLEQAQAMVTQLRLEVDELNARNIVLADERSTLEQTLTSISTERDRLQASIAHFDDLYDPLEADRLLLVELRKGLPETRPEVEAQLARIKRLALSSNPSRLGQVVHRVGEAAPAFLDWRFDQFATTEEATAAYVSSGANAFESNMDAFRDAVLLSVANRLDGLLNVIDRVR
jgi:FtsZ-binding cell division protein ZapB